MLIWYGVLATVHLALPSLLGPGPVEPTPPDLVDPTSLELTQRYEQGWPGWLDMLDIVLMVSVPLVLLTALVSQTVPTADAYFRLRRRRTANGQPA
ncbi:hypothetical protein [Actinoplanes xinjiangensis]|uniref:hypothetical protein n=1 Tax=Actinoplanes xinjiangensis TaxID=512350 RepID=UPI0011B3A1A7|nr:hypothetical protein [Actinoplanes xinjiangensis]